MDITLEKIISIKELRSKKLKIIYGNSKTVLVRPADNEKFLDLMNKLCPLLDMELHH